MKKITTKDLSVFEQSVKEKPVQQALKRVLFSNDLTTVLHKQERIPANQFMFSHDIKTLPVANQKQSGRCWIFAGLNVLREVLVNKYQLSSFEFSQNYTAFYDKFEKINYFIESIDDFLDVDQDDRTLQHILRTGIQDGGQWDMFVSLIEKYGVVPQTYMAETIASSKTRPMNTIINFKLRQYAAKARKLHQAGQSLTTLKQETLDELYTFLVSCFGEPPKTIDFSYVNKDNEFHEIKHLTPQAFYKEAVDVDLNDYVSLIHSPTMDKPYMKSYTVAYLGNIVGGKEITYLNVEMTELKRLVIKQLKHKEVVWFGSDVSRYGDRKLGVWDTDYYDDDLLGMDMVMSKEDQLDYAQSLMTHAMVLTGVHLEDDKPVRFKIENSWGDTTGHKGYYLASDAWFDQFVYQAVIHKKYLSKEQLSAYEDKPKELKPWDPMGALAQ